MRRFTLPATVLALGALLFSAPGFAQDSDEEEYKPQLPDVSIYKAMLDVNKPTGWVQFRNYDDKQLIYFTTLQTMHCRLSEIRYSVNTDLLDQRMPLGECNPQIPFNLPDDSSNKYLYISLPAHEAKTIAIQVVWDDGAGSEIVIYKPCENVDDATCAQIKTIKKPSRVLPQPQPADSPVKAMQEQTPGKNFSEPSPAAAGRP